MLGHKALRWGLGEAPHSCFSPVPLGSRWRVGGREAGDQVRKGQVGQEDVGWGQVRYCDVRRLSKEGRVITLQDQSLVWTRTEPRASETRPRPAYWQGGCCFEMPPEPGLGARADLGRGLLVTEKGDHK